MIRLAYDYLAEYPSFQMWGEDGGNMRPAEIRAVVQFWMYSSGDLKKTVTKHYESIHGGKYSSQKWVKFMLKEIRLRDQSTWIKEIESS